MTLVLAQRWHLGLPELRCDGSDRQVGVVVLANTARSVDRLGVKLVDLLVSSLAGSARVF